MKSRKNYVFLREEIRNIVENAGALPESKARHAGIREIGTPAFLSAAILLVDNLHAFESQIRIVLVDHVGFVVTDST